jgi:hypothetical protein
VVRQEVVDIETFSPDGWLLADASIRNSKSGMAEICLMFEAEIAKLRKKEGA